MTEPRSTYPRKSYMTPQALKQARRWVGLSQTALAAKLGVSQQQYAKWESRPRPEKLEEYYKGPKHRGISLPLAEALQRRILEYAEANSIDTEPLKKLFATVS